MIAPQNILSPMTGTADKTRSTSNPLLTGQKSSSKGASDKPGPDFASLVLGQAKKPLKTDDTPDGKGAAQPDIETNLSADKMADLVSSGSDGSETTQQQVAPIKAGASTAEVVELKAEFTSQLKDLEKAIAALTSETSADDAKGKELIGKLSKLSKSLSEALEKLKATLQKAVSSPEQEIDPDALLEQIGDVVAELTKQFDMTHETNFTAIMSVRAENLLNTLQAKGQVAKAAAGSGVEKNISSTPIRSVSDVFAQVKNLLEPPKENMIRARAFAESRKFDLAVMRASASASSDKSAAPTFPGFDIATGGDNTKLEKLLGDITQNLGSRPQGARPAEPLMPLTMPLAASSEVQLTKDEIDTAMRAMSASKSSEISTEQSSRFSSLITKQIRSMTLTGDRTRIQLAPQGLGDVEIDVHTDPSGKVRAIVRSDNPLVLDSLKNEKDQLANLLEEKGAEIGDSDLQFEEFGDRGNDASDDEGDEADDGEILDTETDDDATETNQTWSRDGSLNLLT